MQEKEIIEERIKNQKRQYTSIETGMYICGDIIKFKRIDLFDESFHMMVPEEFLEMPVKFQRVKYPSEFRPQVIMTSMDLSVNLGLTLFSQKSDAKEVRVILESIKSLIKKSYPDYRFFKSEYKRDERQPYGWFDFKSYAFDDSVYNVQFVMLIRKNILQGSLNCPYAKAEDWKRAMLQMIKSIEKTEGTGFERKQNFN